MNKLSKSLFGILLALVLAIGLSSCGEVEYNVSFVVDGKLYATVQVAENEPIKLPENPVKDGYTFDGWYTDEALTKPFSFGITLITEDITLYARWS